MECNIGLPREIKIPVGHDRITNMYLSIRDINLLHATQNHFEQIQIQTDPILRLNPHNIFLIFQIHWWYAKSPSLFRPNLAPVLVAACRTK